MRVYCLRRQSPRGPGKPAKDPRVAELHQNVTTAAEDGGSVAGMDESSMISYGSQSLSAPPSPRSSEVGRVFFLFFFLLHVGNVTVG